MNLKVNAWAKTQIYVGIITVLYLNLSKKRDITKVTTEFTAGARDVIMFIPAVETVLY